MSVMGVFCSISLYWASSASYSFCSFRCLEVSLLSSFFLTFMATSTDSVQIGGGIGNVARNAPFIIARTLNAVSFIGAIVIAILTASAISRDRELGSREIFYSTPLRKLPFLGGRFVGSVLVAAATVVGAAVGIALASVMPWQDAQQIQPFSAAPYIYAFAAFVLPNLVLAGAIFFAVALLTGRALYTYVAMIGFFAFYGIAQSFLGDLEDEALAVLIDPFGVAALDLLTRYWTIAERNTLLPAIEGPLLFNRLIWSAIKASPHH